MCSNIFNGEDLCSFLKDGDAQNASLKIHLEPLWLSLIKFDQDMQQRTGLPHPVLVSVDRSAGILPKHLIGSFEPKAKNTCITPNWMSHP